MRRTLVGVVAIVLLAGTTASGQGGKKKAKDEELFQGAWEVIAFKAGSKTNDVKSAEKMLVTFKGDKVAFKTGGPKGKEEEASFKLNPAASPRTITLEKKVEAKAKDKGPKTQTVRGIYELKGDALRLGFPSTASEVADLDFDTPGLVIMVLTKQKQAKK
jgi:uncharacterized protein (TIGR03067 family)